MHICSEGVSSNLDRSIKDGRLPRVGRISPADTVTAARWWPWMATKSSPAQLEFGLGGHGLAWERYGKEDGGTAKTSRGSEGLRRHGNKLELGMADRVRQRSTVTWIQAQKTRESA